MISVKLFMVVFDGFCSLELMYLANHAKISHVQLISIHFIQEMAQSYILRSSDLFHTFRESFAGELFYFKYQDDILKFWRWLRSLELKERTKRVS